MNLFLFSTKAQGCEAHQRPRNLRCLLHPDWLFNLHRRADHGVSGSGELESVGSRIFCGHHSDNGGLRGLCGRCARYMKFTYLHASNRNRLFSLKCHVAV